MFVYDSGSRGSRRHPQKPAVRKMHIASNPRVNNAGWRPEPISEACVELMTRRSKEIPRGHGESEMKESGAFLHPALDRTSEQTSVRVRLLALTRPDVWHFFFQDNFLIGCFNINTNTSSSYYSLGKEFAASHFGR